MAKPHQTKETQRFELTGIGLIAFGALSWVSLSSNKAGTLGALLAVALKWLAGKGSFIVPAGLIAAGLRIMIVRNPVNQRGRTYAVLALIAVLFSYLHLGISPELYFSDGVRGEGGGILGALGAFLLYHAFGLLGAYIVLGSVTLCCFLVLTDLSIAVLTGASAKKLVQMVKGLREHLTEFIFETISEDEEAAENDDRKAAAKLRGGKPGAKASDSPWEEGPKGKGRGIIDFAKSTVEEAAEKVRPKVNLYPDAWDQPSRAQNTSPLPGLRPIVEHTQEILRLQDPPANEEKEASAASTELVPNAKADLNGYNLPPVSLLSRPTRPKGVRQSKDIAENARILEETLENFGVKAKVTDVSRGPTITRYEVQPAAGVKVSRIVSLADDLALTMAAADVRIEAPIPGKAAVGIEVPNKEISPVFLREIIEADEFMGAGSRLTVALGKDIAGCPIMADLARMPHLLIAGSTGSGKSVCMNAIIASILFKASPDEVKFLMIDPKMVELTTYNGIPHLIAPVVTDPKKAAAALRWVVHEMENRYSLFAAGGVKNLEGYNAVRTKAGEESLPQVVVFIDELADLMMVAPADVEDAICRLAQMARAAGIHLVVATQRPSVDVITGLIKANIPSRIAFAVSSQIDSRTILDMAGAEKLLGKGDMLFFPVGIPKPVRVQGVFVSEKEVEDVVEYLKGQGVPEYSEGVTKIDETRSNREQGFDDDLLPEAAKLMIECGQASISMLQRRFRVGYARAARLMDIMEERGIVGGYEGSKPRNVLMTLESWEEEFGGKVE